MLPSHPAGRDLAEGHYHDLDYLEFLDRIGGEEAWIGSHYTIPTEPAPSNDLLAAQTLLRTKKLRVNPGAFLLPFFHPAELAHRIAWLDHIAKGRMIVGIGASAVPTDLDLFGIDYTTNQNREMMEESLELIRWLWSSTEPGERKGKYWTVRHPKPIGDILQFHLRPYQKPHPPFAITGFSPGSPTLKLAGKHGMIPCSISFGERYLKGHWDSVTQGAEAAGRAPPSKNEWRVVRIVVVADTDAKARELALNGPPGQHYRRFYLPMLKGAGLLNSLKHDQSVPDSDVTVEYLVDHCWTVGSEETVLNKLGELHRMAGGFGVLAVNNFDHLDHLQAWRDSVERLQKNVLPKLP
jgi:alkanesulfonate monooxygenase SsuD/methylene tetrahydromethanopterin reductase-like flavin-dependent oxidoreductase (luciferase family)